MGINNKVQKALSPAFKQLKDWRGIVGVEIGVYEGINAGYYLQELDVKRVFLIDPFIAYEGYDPKKIGLKKGLADAEKTACVTLRRYENKIRWIKMKSAEAAGLFLDESLDFVYIDGNHSYDSVREDVSLYYPKLKEGGLFSGHDYDYPDIKKAVDEFAGPLSLNLHIEDTGEMQGKEKLVWWAWKKK